MAEITATQVKELRERTGAGMMECKKALVENAADIEAAADWLRKTGLAKADKKAAASPPRAALPWRSPTRPRSSSRSIRKPTSWPRTLASWRSPTPSHRLP
jgi:hypothetical protein